MNRIRLSLPEDFYFSTELTIRITDLNYGGHVGNDAFLSLIHEARQQFLVSHGYTELGFAGYGLIMADVAIEYKKELNYGNSVRISVAAADFDRLGFDLYYKIELLTPENPILAGVAKTGMMCYDYTAGKKVSIPGEAIARLSKRPSE
ncbi:acyl-CoA thioesterase [Sediminibacterium ginsengisoli]|uniref:Acyl-CoA thioesterase FadM n=1 Tax=Sediminibacterium ginsengisoli TaxID=413434 RepID=A0A1T4PXS2_9BACT|nr:thioesterase family protein [Sediminibacterium ginsengisoli]SJZ96126.1 Acyl-CoA thioesterase FadM [Sediminibacterium ginsengisoli]